MEDFQHYLKLINNCDPSDPLLSETSLGERLAQIPLSLVVKSDLNHMTQALNSEQLIPTEAGLARDYRGLAELMGFRSVELENCIKRSYNPTRSLIDAFIINRKDVTLNDLLKLIENIERFDVIDDILPTLVKLASSAGDKLQVSIKESNQAVQIADSNNEITKFNRLTIDDRPDSMIIIYDAFICYAPEDTDYARELIDLLEANGKSVAIADDLLPGHFEHDALVRLIDTRCRKVIIVLTPNFSRSKECEFQTKFASEIGIKAESPKIIPVLYEFCDDSILPSMVKVLSKIDMTNQANRQWQLLRLIRSLSEEHETQMIGARRSFSRMNHINNTSRIDARQGAQDDGTNSPSPSNYRPQHSNNRLNPTITISSTRLMYNNSSSSSGPIIDVAESENSRDLELRQTSESSSTQLLVQEMTSPTNSSSNPINWLKKQVKRHVLRIEELGTLSQTNLISSSYSDDKYSFDK